MAPRDTLTVGRSLVVWRPAGKAAVAAPATGAPGRIRQVRYTVRAGDSLHRIASKFRVTVNDLLSWNRLDGGKFLQPGQKLVMFVDVMAQSGGG
jgi:membrane-bound lytic murein transglycosylase D